MTALENRDEFDQQAQPAELATALDHASLLLGSCLDPQSALLMRLSRLSERLAHQRLQLAILGQFKRGKSTFVNALLGVPLLPAAVVPITAIATFIAWGAKPLVRISFIDQRPPEECSTARRRSDTRRPISFRCRRSQSAKPARSGKGRAVLSCPYPVRWHGAHRHAWRGLHTQA